VGVLTLIVVLAVMSGFEKTIKEKILGTQAHLVVLKASQQGMDHYGELIKEVEQVKGVVSATPFIYTEVMLSSESNVTGGVIKGIDPDRVGKVTELAHNMKAGRLQDLKEESGLVFHSTNRSR
jgi:lipoprotein-releasing system permease protein